MGASIDYSGIVRPLCSLCGVLPRVGRRSKTAPGTIIFESKCKRCYADNTVVERPYDEMARDFRAQLETLLAGRRVCPDSTKDFRQAPIRRWLDAHLRNSPPRNFE